MSFHIVLFVILYGEFIKMVPFHNFDTLDVFWGLIKIVSPIVNQYIVVRILKIRKIRKYFKILILIFFSNFFKNNILFS